MAVRWRKAPKGAGKGEEKAQGGAAVGRVKEAVERAKKALPKGPGAEVEEEAEKEAGIQERAKKPKARRTETTPYVRGEDPSHEDPERAGGRGKEGSSEVVEGRERGKEERREGEREDGGKVTDGPPNQAGPESVPPQQNAKSLLRRGTWDSDRARLKLKQLPVLACGTCNIGPECPEYKPGYVCAFKDALTAFDTRDEDAVRALMNRVLQENVRRWQTGLIGETIVGGGVQDTALTQLSEVVTRQARGLLELDEAMRPGSLSVQISGPKEAVSQAAPGILSKLFGGGPGPVTMVEAPVEVVTVGSLVAPEAEIRRGDVPDPRDPIPPGEALYPRGEEGEGEEEGPAGVLSPQGEGADEDTESLTEEAQEGQEEEPQEAPGEE